MLLEKIQKLRIILGSQSPRRFELLKSLDLDFEVLVKSIDETIPSEITAEAAAEYIALRKLEAFTTEEYHNALVITSDTVVVDNFGGTLGKPQDENEAKLMLRKLSASEHFVYTGVAISLKGKIRSFTCSTKVVFASLSYEEIDYYVSKYKPFDKAGSYGIQEWIGRIGVESIRGSYENVMGLPTSRLYSELKEIEKGL